MYLINDKKRIPLKGKHVLVLGAGKSGISAAKLLKKIGCHVCLMDKNSNALTSTTSAELLSYEIEIRLGFDQPIINENYSAIIISPGYPVLKLIKSLHEIGLAELPEIMGELELAWRCLDHETVIAITGTSGKTTTTSIIASILCEHGSNIFVGGNIGTPLSDYILSNKKSEILALEVSSFQLQTCSTFAPHISAFLNITPNHLDYHNDMKEYITAKRNIFINQKKDNLAILGEQVKKYIEPDFPRCKIVWINNHYRFPQNQLFGNHNQINMEAAWQVCSYLNVPFEVAKKAIKKFKPLPHRLELAGEIDGTIFVNDSKSTTVSSLEVALGAFSRPILLLCGGKFKGGDLTLLCNVIKEKVKKVALFGDCKEYFEQAWKDIVPLEWYPTLEEAMIALNFIKKPNDVILLSPATASFDQYSNYEERGDDFKRIFHSLKAKK